MKNISTLLLLLTSLGTAFSIQAQPQEQVSSVDLGQFNLDTPPAERLGRANAPVDLTGTWVSIVNEDWRFRMVTPQIGDVANIPINDRALEYAENWRPEMDQGNECRAYGAPAIMHEPGRIEISWEDDMTLRMDFDAGRQTRLLHFDYSVEPGAASRQGHSLAQWKQPRGAQVAPAITNVVPIGQQFPRTENVSNTLQINTSNLIEGYLRKNGIPHSDQVEVREYYDLINMPDGSTWLIANIIVEDPVYLSAPWVTSMNFKKEEDDSNRNPQDCFVTNPGW
ncbi:MAG: hypothetical protein CMP91_00015 [Gammaproteobacteria bacterium]|mgnify:CR=1 FL=1|nr:hypothetical protein [Gammaproteobacteria bacterium]MAY03968.1 hypothetical protein [Gammaproteobacteria bacterium]|tara:strand:- start:1452 stop:2294 length:843 start_codon:yes stop_codon:yes gene_type:complete